MLAHRRFAILSLVTASLALGACGSEGDPPDEDGARTGWRSTQTALAGAGVDVQAQWMASGTIDDNGVTGMVTGTLPCPDGGSLEVESTGEVTEQHVFGDVRIEFDGCEADGVVIDGYLHQTGEVTETKVSSQVSGELVWTGAAQGTCDIDLEANVTTDGVSASGSFGGKMCGYGYDELWG